MAFTLIGSILYKISESVKDTGWPFIHFQVGVIWSSCSYSTPSGNSCLTNAFARPNFAVVSSLTQPFLIPNIRIVSKIALRQSERDCKTRARNKEKSGGKTELKKNKPMTVQEIRLLFSLGPLPLWAPGINAFLERGKNLFLRGKAW